MGILFPSQVYKFHPQFCEHIQRLSSCYPGQTFRANPLLFLLLSPPIPRVGRGVGGKY